MHPKKRSGISRYLRVALDLPHKCTEPRGPLRAFKRSKMRLNGCVRFVGIMPLSPRPPRPLSALLLTNHSRQSRRTVEEPAQTETFPDTPHATTRLGRTAYTPSSRRHPSSAQATAVSARGQPSLRIAVRTGAALGRRFV